MSYQATDSDLPEILFVPAKQSEAGLSVPLAGMEPFSLTPLPFCPPSREDFLIAEMERRFGGKAVPFEPEIVEPEVVEPELYRPPQLQEPEWTGGFRGNVAKLLWQDHGLKKKAIRFLNCNKQARPGKCELHPDEHKFFIPNGCEVIFCKECADESRRELLHDYWHVICNAVLDFTGERKEHERLCELLAKSEEGLERQRKRELGELWARVGKLFPKPDTEKELKKPIPERTWVLARVTFTLRSDGSEITPERVKKFNACVGEVMRCAVGSRKGYGMLFVDEVGFEKRGHLPDQKRVAHGLNLHCHGLYFGPLLEWRRLLDEWMEVTKRKFGVESCGVYITRVKRFGENPAGAIRRALNHMLKYTSKPPAVTPERLASLIAAFDGAKRVHSLGLFYGKKPQREKKECHCPKCRALGIVSAVSFEGKTFASGACIPRLESIEDLLARGYVPLREAGRETALAMGASREDSWGASP